MYSLVCRAICVAVYQLLSSCMILWFASRDQHCGVENCTPHILLVPKNNQGGSIAKSLVTVISMEFAGLLGSLFFGTYDNGCWVAAEWRDAESGGQNHMPDFLQVLRKSHGSPQLSDRSRVCFCKLSGAIGIIIDQNKWWVVLFRFRKLASRHWDRESYTSLLLVTHK